MNRHSSLMLVACCCALLGSACGGRPIGDDPAQQPVENAQKLELTVFEWQWVWNLPGEDGVFVIRDATELARYCPEHAVYPRPEIDFATEVGLRHRESMHDRPSYHRLHDAWQTNAETIVRLRAERAGHIDGHAEVMEIAKLPRMGTPIRFVKLPLSTAD